MDQQTIVPLYELFKALLIFADVFLLAFFIFLFAKSWEYRPHFGIARETEIIYSLGNVVLQERWESIINRSRISSAESVKSAIIDADNMVNETLQRMGLKGEHMADRLENLTTEDFATLNRVWSAHQFRNKIVHEPGFVISQSDAWKALDDYASFLKEIGVIK